MVLINEKRVSARLGEAFFSLWMVTKTIVDAAQWRNPACRNLNNEDRLSPRVGDCLRLRLMVCMAAIAESNALCRPELAAAFAFFDCAPTSKIEIECKSDVGFLSSATSSRGLVMLLSHAIFNLKSNLISQSISNLVGGHIQCKSPISQCQYDILRSIVHADLNYISTAN